MSSTSSRARHSRFGCERRIDSDQTVRRGSSGIVERTGRAPELIRCDNGPELTANALRDWCRFSEDRDARTSSRARRARTPTSRSFGSRIRDELLAVEQFRGPAEAKVMVEDWRHDHNNHRPRSALGMMTPPRFAKAWREAVVEGKGITLVTGAKARTTPRDTPVPAAVTANQPDHDQGADQVAPAVLLRSPRGACQSTGRPASHCRRRSIPAARL